MLSFFKSVFSFIFKSIPLFAKKIYYSRFNREIFNRISKNKDVFLEVLQFPKKNKKFVSKVFASEESVSCFELFLDAHEKDERKYSRDSIQSLFVYLDISQDVTKLIELLIDYNIPIYSNDSAKLYIKEVLRMGINIKKKKTNFFYKLYCPSMKMK